MARSFSAVRAIEGAEPPESQRCGGIILGVGARTVLDAARSEPDDDSADWSAPDAVIKSRSVTVCDFSIVTTDGN
jgi:hypothetical protein